MAKAENHKKASQSPPNMHPSGYSLGSFSEQEWSDAEGSTGLDRRAILFNLNQYVKTNIKVREAVGVLESRLAEQSQKESMYRKEADRFLYDIPSEMMRSPENRNKRLRRK